MKPIFYVGDRSKYLGVCKRVLKFEYFQIPLHYPFKLNVYIITWKKEVNQWKSLMCILLSGNFIISVYFIPEFLKALQKSLDLRICHTSSEDIV